VKDGRSRHKKTQDHQGPETNALDPAYTLEAGREPGSLAIACPRWDRFSGKVTSGNLQKLGPDHERNPAREA